jgi:hypothetical protein
MKSNLLSASIFALAAMAAGHSYAEGREPFPEVNTPQVASTQSRDAVKLAQVQVKGDSSTAVAGGRL